MKQVSLSLAILLTTLFYFPVTTLAVPIISKVVWSYDVNPNSLAVDKPGSFWRGRPGRFTGPKQFEISFGLYNFTNRSISITGISFDFWEDDGLVGDDKLVNDLTLVLPKPFVLKPTNISFAVSVTAPIGGDVTNLNWDPKFNLPSAVKTPFYNFTVAASDLNKGTNSSFDRNTVGFTDAAAILLRPFGSATDINITAHEITVPEPSIFFLLCFGIICFLTIWSLQKKRIQVRW